ncbi:MAG: flotillin domain-containing protein [Candidatus Poribacteria bacterium]|mgnify:CR=1 FL=1|nr:flotillin domain-containing protein [Candidatus Poribacteria bacterium]
MRLIVLVITLFVVAVLVGFLAYQQTDQYNLVGLARWVSISFVLVFVLSGVFLAFVVRYKKPKADMSLVRTGGGGEKISITSGLWLNTIIHEVKEISLNTMVLEVLREGEDAFITLDFNRANVEAVFYLQVEPNEEDILRAAQALGDKSMTPETIRELIEPKLEGALRSVAAESEITELLQKRVEFAEKVDRAVGENLKNENGLKLEAVSIIRVDQTPLETYKEENQFDARGIRTITEITAEQAKETEQIEQEKEVAIVKIIVDARIQKLEAEQDQAWAESDQQKNIAIYAAEREADTMKFQFEMEQEVQEREFLMKQEVEKARVAQEQAIEEREIEKIKEVELAKVEQEQTVQIREIEKNLMVETEQIEQMKAVQIAEIEKDLTVEIQRFDQEEQVGIREQGKLLEIERAKIGQEEGVALRDIEKALSVETSKFSQEQAVQEREIEKNLVIETAQINQNRQVELTEIDKVLEVEQSRIGQELSLQLIDEDRNIAVAGKQVDTANAQKNQLVAEAGKAEAEIGVIAVQQTKEAEWQREVAVIGAEAQAQPIERLADAVLAEATAKAQGEMAHMEARNVAEQRVLVQEAIMELIDGSADIVEQLMRPVEKIDSIKILDMGGSEGQKDGVNRSTMGRLANNLLDTGAISPMLKELFDFADVDAEKIANKISEYLSSLTRRES